MLNVILGIAFVVVAIAALVWRTMGDARAVASGEKPDAAGPTGTGIVGSDFSGIGAGVDGGSAGQAGGSADGGGAGQS